MTTWCKGENALNYTRPHAALRGNELSLLSKKIGRGGVAVAGAFAFSDAISAYDEAYAAGAGLPEDRRQSDAEAAVAASFALSGTGAISAWAVPTAAMSLGAGPTGTAVSIVAGCALSLFLQDRMTQALSADYNGDGVSTQQDFADWWYENGHKEVLRYQDSIEYTRTHPTMGTARL